MNTRFVIILGVCAFVAANSSLAVADNVLMASFKASYESNLQAIVGSDASSDCIARYGQRLDSIAEGLKKDGNLDGVVAVREEKKRLDAEKTVPEDSGADLIPSIVKARAEYRQSVAKAEVEKNKKIMALADGYADSLETLKKQLTQQDKIEEATEVKQEIERLRTSPEVTAAQFVLADLVLKTTPSPGAAKSTRPGTSGDTPGATSAPKSSKSRRSVDCKGNSTSGGWTVTTMDVKEGDTVTIRASGSWKCVGLSQTCGPNGYPGPGTGWWYKTGRYRYYDSMRYGWNRHLQDEQYGALVCKVGDNGSIRLVGASLTFTSTEGGRLCLDSNVAPGRDARQGCTGSLAVDIEVQRGTP